MAEAADIPAERSGNMGTEQRRGHAFAPPLPGFKDLRDSFRTTPFRKDKTVNGEFARALLARQLNYSSPGVGTVGHLMVELFKDRAQIDLVHIPYKGGAPSLNAVVAGEVHFSSSDPGSHQVIRGCK